MTASAGAKQIAGYLRSVVGGTPRVNRFWDDDRTHHVDVMQVADRPDTGVTTCATLTLSDHAAPLTADGRPLHVELIGAAAAGGEGANLIASCAFSIVKREVTPVPGAVIPRIAELYFPQGPMKHVLMVSPFLWTLETRSLGESRVAWLQIIPISDAERDFATQHGPDALEERFEAAQIDVYDLRRPSCI